jgi:hypothetical protein
MTPSKFRTTARLRDPEAAAFPKPDKVAASQK